MCGPIIYQPIFLVYLLKLHLFQCRKQTKLKMFESCSCSMDWIILGPFLPFDCTNVIRYRSDMYYKNVKFHDDQHILILLPTAEQYQYVGNAAYQAVSNLHYIQLGPVHRQNFGKCRNDLSTYILGSQRQVQQKFSYDYYQH